MQLTIKEKVEVIIMKMDSDLVFIKADNPLQLEIKSYQIVREAAGQLNIDLEKYNFVSPKEEIDFFKNIKPRIYRELIYHNELYHIEASKPFTEKEKIVTYLAGAINKYQQYFEKYRRFYNYYLMGQTHFDTVYFIRNTEAPIPPEDSVDCDS